MKKPAKPRPPGYMRLTLSTEAANLVFQRLTPIRGVRAAVQREPGKWDLAVSFSVYDQLQTAALPQENLSNTILRLYAFPKGATAS